MRQMKKKIIIAIIVTLLLTAAVAFTVTHFIVKSKDEEIKTLQEQVVDTKCLAFANDLDAKSIITQSDLKEIDIKLTSISSGTYKVINGDTTNVMHYISFVDEDGTTKTSNIKIKKEDLVGRVVKTNVSQNTLLMDSLLFAEDEDPTKDERLQEFNFIQIPSDLIANDYIDIRIQFPAGEDYSVLIGKKVEKTAGENTIFIKMNEEEIMAMGSAIIEAYMQDGVRLYANKYTDPSTQLLKETTADYVAKYEYAVEKVIADRTELNLRKEIAKLLSEDGTIIVAAGDVIDSNGTVATEDTTITITTEIIDDVTYITKDMLDIIPGSLKNEAMKNVAEVTIDDLKAEDLVEYAGIKKDYIEEIMLANKNHDEDILNYYRVMKVITRDEIIRSYPVKKEVLAVIKTNPNLLETIKNEFDTRALLNTRIDKYEELEAQYNAAYDDYTKQEIKKQMDDLVNNRTGNVQKNLQAEIAAQKAERVSYLESLING